MRHRAHALPHTLPPSLLVKRLSYPAVFPQGKYLSVPLVFLGMSAAYRRSAIHRNACIGAAQEVAAYVDTVLVFLRDFVVEK